MEPHFLNPILWPVDRLVDQPLGEDTEGAIAEGILYSRNDGNGWRKVGLTSKGNRRWRAYELGFQDGLDWDLDGYETLDEVKRDGWDDATISAMGATWCRNAWGALSDDDWGAACRAYNAGAYAGAMTAQDRRTGLPPRRVE